MARSQRVQMIRTERIKPNPLQPRRHFDPAALQELYRLTSERNVIP